MDWKTVSDLAWEAQTFISQVKMCPAGGTPLVSEIILSGLFVQLSNITSAGDRKISWAGDQGSVYTPFP